jgi:hypothetical protein
MRWRVAAAVGALLAALAPSTAPATRSAPPGLPFGKPLAGPPRHLAGASWAGGSYPVPAGGNVTVYVSTSYADPDAVAERWAAFFGGLPHGSELSLVRVYIAPLDEVHAMCRSAEALGCYGAEQLVVVGDAEEGIEATMVAAHEYGHHIAANRNNAPWPALDWGTKRWASAIGVCRRVAGGTAFPGDEGFDYSLNPGEAFAETYRVLAETGGAAEGFEWPIVDPSFEPDSAALAAVRADVLEPWTGPSVATIRGRFAGSARSWTRSIATPLDGDVRIRVSPVDELTVAESSGTVLARSHWAGSGAKELDFRVCGQRSLRLRVSRETARASFTLRVSLP